MFLTSQKNKHSGNQLILANEFDGRVTVGVFLRPMIPVALKSTWSYVGDDGGRGDCHMVIWVGNDEIITTSFKDEKSAARTFMGTRARFMKEFKPYSPPKGGKWFGKSPDTR